MGAGAEGTAQAKAGKSNLASFDVAKLEYTTKLTKRNHKIKSIYSPKDPGHNQARNIISRLLN